MLPNNRLDFISNIDSRWIQKMTDIRMMFMALDSLIQTQVKEDSINKSEAARTASIARTHLETSLQYTIKTFCLLGEIKDA